MRGLCLAVGTRTTNGRSILHSDPSSRFRVPNVPSQMSPTGVPGSGGVGYGLMNEPNPGWIGIHDLTQAWQWSHSSNSLTPCVPRVAAPPPMFLPPNLPGARTNGSPSSGHAAPRCRAWHWVLASPRRWRCAPLATGRGSDVAVPKECRTSEVVSCFNLFFWLAVRHFFASLFLCV